MRTPYKLSGSRIAVAALVALLVFAGTRAVAGAQTAGFETLPTGASIDMSIPLFKSRVVVVDLPTSRVAVGNPDVADHKPPWSGSSVSRRLPMETMVATCISAMGLSCA